MSEHILVTGGTGMVGKQLIPKILENTEAQVYVLTHENGTRLGRPEFMLQALGMEYKEEFAERLNLVPGDITEENFGTAASGRLRNKITAVFHAAAETRYDLSIDEVRRVNVKGTQNTIDFAKTCTRLQRFGFLSTVYVAGKNRGWIKEDFHDSCGFVNTYEQSKFEAEEILRASTDLPWSIYRLSTMLGDSKTGETQKIITPHIAIRLIHKGLATIVPGDPDFPIDLVPSDYSIRVLEKLFDEKFERNQVYQIASGKSQAITLQTFIDKCYKLFAYMDNDWIERAVEKPLVSADLSQHMENGLRGMKHFADQFLCPKDFDSSNVRRSLPYYDSQLPNAADYIAKVILYCFKTDWRRSNLFRPSMMDLDFA